MSSRPALVLTSDQESVLQEWRHLCLTLERVQGEHLVANCRDKYQFAKTYLVYGRELDQVCVEVKQAARQGSFGFFTSRGTSARHMTAELADEMLKAWRVAVASKRAMVADMFMRRFGEDIDEFLGTPHNASRLVVAVGYDKRDAILELADWTQDKLVGAEIAQLRGDVAMLRREVDELAANVARWLPAT
jgi:hypothetical protein